MRKLIYAVCCLLLAAGLADGASAVQVDSGAVYCFGAEEFGQSPLEGICITQLPGREIGLLMLGDRELHCGDVLTASQVSAMTFVCTEAEADSSASFRYLPVFADGLSGEASMTFSIRSRENKAPIAEDSAFETYKNLEVTGTLKVQDPEGETMQFSVIRQPRRGTVSIREDGSFTYTPKKNKVGIDSFTYTAADASGKVSREAAVTVTILKPSDAKQYTDTVGADCRFAAEWMKNTGIFVGETLAGSPCFSPDRTVTRGEFLTMLVKALNLPTDPAIAETGYADAPDWLKPYLAAAIRSGLTAGLPARESFGANELVTAEEAASLLCAALDLHAIEQPALSAEGESVPPTSLEIANANGFPMPDGQVITRGHAAMMMYQAAQYNS